MRPEQIEMNINTYYKCFDICEEVKIARDRNKIRIRDYPAAIVSCADAWANYVSAETGRSGKVDRDSYYMAPKLETALRILGDIGSIRTVCRNPIGACAEPHAARAVMMKNPATEINDLVFSYAYRPRTKTVLRYCRNCTDVFNIQNP